MYGFEAMTGLGGLAAQAPGGNVYAGRALQIRSPGAMIVGDVTTDPGHGILPYNLGGQLGSGGMVSAGGGAVTQPMDRQLGNWRDILDWHNSPAIWFLGFLLLAYGYVHVSYRRGRASLAGGVR